MAGWVRVLLVLCVALPSAACSGGLVADHLPVWAGGEPADVPPRPGTPEYEAYRQKLQHPPRPAPATASQTQTEAQAVPPAANGTAASGQPSRN